MLIDSYFSSFLMIVRRWCLIANGWLIRCKLSLLLQTFWDPSGTFWVHSLCWLDFILWRRSFEWFLIVKWLGVLGSLLEICLWFFSWNVSWFFSFVVYNRWIISWIFFFLLNLLNLMLFQCLSISGWFLLFHCIIMRWTILLLWRSIFLRWLIFFLFISSDNLNSIFNSLNFSEKVFVHWSLENWGLLWVVLLLDELLSYWRFWFHNPSSH